MLKNLLKDLTIKLRKKLPKLKKIICNYHSMSNKALLDNIKRLREMTGVGFKDCKIALDETKGDIDKSIEF